MRNGSAVLKMGLRAAVGRPRPRRRASALRPRLVHAGGRGRGPEPVCCSRRAAFRCLRRHGADGLERRRPGHHGLFCPSGPADGRTGGDAGDLNRGRVRLHRHSRDDGADDTSANGPNSTRRSLSSIRRSSGGWARCSRSSAAWSRSAGAAVCCCGCGLPAGSWLRGDGISTSAGLRAADSTSAPPTGGDTSPPRSKAASITRSRGGRSPPPRTSSCCNRHC